MDMIGLESGVSLADLTTLRVGGTAKWFMPVHQSAQLSEAVRWAVQHRLPYLFIGSGSNILFSDSGYPGVVLKNRFLGFEQDGSEITVAGGEDLGETIRRVNSAGLSGMERMYGIPGTVAGAVVGNAGAYGQEIKDSVIDIKVWSQEGIRTYTREEADFGYRRSLFKRRRNLFVLSCRLKLKPTSEDLNAISEEILERRRLKYPPDLRCPGSFFKNIVAGELPPATLARIPPDFIQFGKIPAGKLLEQVGAKGACRGDAMFADYHGNLLLNRCRARSRDVLELANEYAQRVADLFNVRLEPEIWIVGDDIPANLVSSEDKT